MAIYDWNNRATRPARIFDAKGCLLSADIIWIDTVTGVYRRYKLNAEGELYVEGAGSYRHWKKDTQGAIFSEGGEIAEESGRYASTPLRIEWKCNRLLWALERLGIRWHGFWLKVACWWSTGRWPKKSQ